MCASQIGVEELLPQERYRKITLIILVQVKNLSAVVQLEESWEELSIGISSKYLINTQLLIQKQPPEVFYKKRRS